MLSKEVLEALNKQVQQELTAEYGYLSLSVWFEKEVLKGFAAFFRQQAAEERTHAMKLLDYAQDRGAVPTLLPVQPPSGQWKNVLEAVTFAREAERKNTAMINSLYETAVKANDLATQNMLQWFINEQVEEEKWAEEYVTMVEKIGASVGSLYMLDHHVSKKAKS